MKHLLNTLLTLALIVSLAACRSSKQVATDSPATAAGATTELTALTADAVIDAVERNRTTAEAMMANVRVELRGFGKDNLSVNGKLCMKRNDCVRLSLRFFGMEVGLIEFTPTDVLFVDRVNKQYARAAYADVRFLRQAKLDFYAVQAIFHGELFVPGERGKLVPNRFQLQRGTASPVLELTQTDPLHYAFTTAQGQLRCLTVKGQNGSNEVAVSCTYDNFTKFAARSFPTQIDFRVDGLQKPFAMLLALSNLKADADWNTRTTVSSKYAKRDLDQVLKGLHL